MSAPAITLVSNTAMVNTGHTETIQFDYLLYSDDYYFENWTDWVNDSVNSPVNNEL